MQRKNLSNLLDEGWFLEDWFGDLLVLTKDNITIIYDLSLGCIV